MKRADLYMRRSSSTSTSREMWTTLAANSDGSDSDPEDDQLASSVDSTTFRRLSARKRRTIYTAGRPPWYASDGQKIDAFVIGLAGGSASGKTSVARKIIESLKVDWVTLLSMDSFYKILTPEQHELATDNDYDFDHPDSFDVDLVLSTLTKLKEGGRVEVPVYDFTTHSRAKYTQTVYGANVIVFEGIMAFAYPELRELMNLKIFVDTDSDIRLARRLQRDVSERGRDLEGVIHQYNRFVKPAFQRFIEPSMQHADIVVPNGAENVVAMQLIVQHVKDKLQERGLQFRSKLLSDTANNGLSTESQRPASLYILAESVQVKGMHTVIRDKRTSRDDFVFFTNRLASLVIEHALSFLPYEAVEVDTPQKCVYSGKRFNGKLCGVSILRAGEVLEPALMSVRKDVTIGKILIQTNEKTGEPELHFLRLPSNISSCHVVLMDATVATGAAAIMAIRVLLDHDVPQGRILFISMLCSELGVHNVAYAFPDVKIITSAVDPNVNENYHILPGIGNFGDRYFGTDV